MLEDFMRRRRKWIGLTVWAVILALILLAIAHTYNYFVDRSRMEEVAKLPNYTGTVAATQPVETEAATEATRAFAPDFMVYDAQGNAVTLEMFRGKPVVLTFWASWRNECKEQMPILNSAYEDYKDTVHFLFVNIPDNRETQDRAEAFLEERGYTFPVYYDTDGNASENYDLQNLPSTYFIDEHGRAMGYAGGKITRPIFERGLAQCYHD